MKYFVLSGVAWQVHATIMLYPVCLLCTVGVLCYYSFAGAVITHNSMHVRCFENTLCEVIWCHLLSLSYGHPVSTFVPGHNIGHHRYTQTTNDPMRTSKVRFRWHLLNLLLFQPSVAWDVLVLDTRYMCVMRTQSDPFFARCCQQWFVLGGVQVVLLYWSWQRFLLYVWLPHACAQWAIVTMNMLQHDGCDPTPPFDAHTRYNYNGARNFVGPVINFLTFNNGYHTIHHLHPTMHWSRLAREHAVQVRGHTHPGLEQQCMARYIFRTFIYPGLRVDFRGKRIEFGQDTEPRDTDWTPNFIVTKQNI